MKKNEKLFGIIALIPAIFALIPLITESVSNRKILIGSIDIKIITAILFSLSAVFLLFTAVRSLIKKDKEKKVSDYIFIFGQTVILSCIIFDCLNSSKDHRYYEFTSPDGNHTVVAEEWTEELSDDSLHGCVMFYVRENKFFVSEKDLYFNYNGYLPISSNCYTVEWNNNRASFTLENVNGEYETITIEC